MAPLPLDPSQIPYGAMWMGQPMPFPNIGQSIDCLIVCTAVISLTHVVFLCWRQFRECMEA